MLLLFLLALPCAAAGLEEALDPEAAAGGLPSGAAEALEGMTVSGVDPDTGLGRIWAYVRLHINAVLTEALRPVGAVLAISVLCAVGEQFTQGNGGAINFVSFGGALAVAAAAVTDVQSVVRMGSETIEDLCEYSHVLLPTLTTAAVSTGAVTSAGAKYAAAALFSDVLLTGAQGLILPLICAYVATETAGAALGTRQLAGASKLLKWSASTLMKGLVLAFTAYLGLTGVLSGAADEAAVKTAKAVMSAALPVVGKTLSDASEALLAGAAAVKSAIGVFGLLAVLAVVALPVLRLLLRYLLYKAAAAVAGIVAGERIGGLIDAVGSAYGMILGLVGAAAAIFFLAVISLLRTVSG